ncbi:MAG: hypothetical protein JXQ27_14310 [Acidobacteria bacterium]|nr:hypothetical protein [Acidobacteriota bacterium]
MMSYPFSPRSSWEALQPLDDKQIRAIQKKLERQRKTAAKEERGILCRSCGHIITMPRLRTTVQGRHVHTFLNPSGIEFTIGCFSDAAGCRNIGIPTTQHTWFPGYGWRIALCAGCQIHLGWQFMGEDQAPFHGLILDLLVE